jgi:diaminopimelate epimerase
VDTKGGVVECLCHVKDGRVRFVTVEMGRATFRAPDIPMNGPDRDVVGVPLQLGDGSAVTATAVSVGNPHCIVFVDRLDTEMCRRVGPLIERHPAFPQRTNVQFARVADRSTLDILIWERGAGYTLASGSSSCGAAAAAVRNGRCEHGRVTVRMPGGELIIDVRPDWSLRLEGPVEEVYTGTLSAEFAEAWLTPATP